MRGVGALGTLASATGVLYDGDSVFRVVHYDDVVAGADALGLAPAFVSVSELVGSDVSFLVRGRIVRDVEVSDSGFAGHTSLFPVTTAHRVIHPMGIEVCCRQLHTFDSGSCMTSIAITM